MDNKEHAEKLLKNGASFLQSVLCRKKEALSTEELPLSGRGWWPPEREGKAPVEEQSDPNYKPIIITPLTERELKEAKESDQGLFVLRLLKTVEEYKIAYDIEHDIAHNYQMKLFEFPIKKYKDPMIEGTWYDCNICGYSGLNKIRHAEDCPLNQYEEMIRLIVDYFKADGDFMECMRDSEWTDNYPKRLDETAINAGQCKLKFLDAKEKFDKSIVEEKD